MSTNNIFEPPTGADLGNLFELQAKRDADHFRVYENRENNGRKFEVTFSGECEEAVCSKAKDCFKSKDPYASASIGGITFDGKYYRRTVSWYSMD